jgi:hypothetical protein
MADIEILDSPPGPPRLKVFNGHEMVTVTEEHPPWAHWAAIKSTAAILLSTLDELQRIAERHQRFTKASSETDPIWLIEHQRLHSYHDMRIALVREIERYLPKLKIPSLRNYRNSWLWNSSLPDKSLLVAELQEVEHRANLKWMKAVDREAKQTWSASAELSIRRKRGRPSLQSDQENDRQRLFGAWERAKGAGVGRKEFCEDQDVTLNHLEKIINWQSQRKRRGKTP